MLHQNAWFNSISTDTNVLFPIPLFNAEYGKPLFLGKRLGAANNTELVGRWEEGGGRGGEKRSLSCHCFRIKRLRRSICSTVLFKILDLAPHPQVPSLYIEKIRLWQLHFFSEHTWTETVHTAATGMTIHQYHWRNPCGHCKLRLWTRSSCRRTETSLG